MTTGAGVGRLLLAELVDTARAHGFHAIMAKIVGDHEASIALHAAPPGSRSWATSARSGASSAGGSTWC